MHYPRCWHLKAATMFGMKRDNMLWMVVEVSSLWHGDGIGRSAWLQFSWHSTHVPSQRQAPHIAHIKQFTRWCWAVAGADCADLAVKRACWRDTAVALAARSLTHTACAWLQTPV